MIHFDIQPNTTTSYPTFLLFLIPTGSIYEAATSLRRIRTLLLEITPSDRIKYCSTDFENATEHVRQYPLMPHVLFISIAT